MLTLLCLSLLTTSKMCKTLALTLAQRIENVYLQSVPFHPSHKHLGIPAINQTHAAGSTRRSTLNTTI